MRICLYLPLMLIGLVAISSASIEYAEWHFDNPWFHTQRPHNYLYLPVRIGSYENLEDILIFHPHLVHHVGLMVMVQHLPSIVRLIHQGYVDV